MRLVCACLLPVALASGCSPGDDDRGARSRASTTIVVDGETIDVAPLTEALAGLCQARLQAASDAPAAKATYDRRARSGVETVARVLQRSYAVLASSMATAVERVRGDATAEPARPSLPEDLGRLSELMREGLARLGVPTPPCER